MTDLLQLNKSVYTRLRYGTVSERFVVDFFLKRHENVRFGLGEKQAHSSRRSRAGEGCAPLRASIKISWPLCPSFPPWTLFLFFFLIFISFFSVSLRAGFVDNSLTIVVNAMNRRETDRQPFDRLLTAETISLNGGQDTNPSRAFFLFCHISTTRLEGASTSLTWLVVKKKKKQKRKDRKRLSQRTRVIRAKFY